MSKRTTQISDCTVANTNPKLWSVVIPAAGLGTRLNHSGPKILYKLNNRYILEWILDMVSEYASEIILILSPSGYQPVNDVLAKLSLSIPIKTCIQPNPIGMADAILRSLPYITKANTMVVWGDQVLVSSHTISACQTLHEKRSNATLTLPTIIRESPYIQIVRNDDDQIIEVKQLREGEITVNTGENDCGIFFFNTRILQTILNDASVRACGIGKLTGEFNLLQILHLFETSFDSVHTLRIFDKIETVGINTQQDAVEVEKILINKGRSTNVNCVNSDTCIQ